jgi:hypothetical protein
MSTNTVTRPAPTDIAALVHELAGTRSGGHEATVPERAWR